MSSIGQWQRGGGRSRDTILPFFGTPCSDVYDQYPSWGSCRPISTGQRRGGGDQEEAADVTALAHANVDWKETDKSHVFRVDLPGVRKEDLKVQVEDDNVLQISGERMVEKEEENDKWHRVERRRGSFSRRFCLPDNADMEGIKCGLEHGVLTVEVPKKEVQEQPRNVRYIDVA